MKHSFLRIHRGTGGIAALVCRGVPNPNPRGAFALLPATVLAWAFACPPAAGQALPVQERPALVDGAGRGVAKPACPSLVDGQGGRVRSRGTGGAAEASFPRDCPGVAPAAHSRPQTAAFSSPARPGARSVGAAACRRDRRRRSARRRRPARPASAPRAGHARTPERHGPDRRYDLVAPAVRLLDLPAYSGSAAVAARGSSPHRRQRGWTCGRLPQRSGSGRRTRRGPRADRGGAGRAEDGADAHPPDGSDVPRPGAPDQCGPARRRSAVRGVPRPRCPAHAHAQSTGRERGHAGRGPAPARRSQDAGRHAVAHPRSGSEHPFPGGAARGRQPDRAVGQPQARLGRARGRSLDAHPAARSAQRRPRALGQLRGGLLPG